MHRGEKEWSLNQSPTVNDWGHDPQLCRKNEVTKTRVGLFDDSGFGQRSLAIGLSTCEFVFSGSFGTVQKLDWPCRCVLFTNCLSGILLGLLR